jgi:hypothetical protein
MLAVRADRVDRKRGDLMESRSGAFDKFAWLKAVYAESRFTSGEKAVLAHIAIFNVLTGGDTFCIRQSTLAEQCGITRQTVGTAIRQAKHFEYLTVSRLHARGYGRHGADELKLLLPQSCNESLLHSGGSDVKQTAESCKANDQSGVKQTAEWSKAANAPTSENNTPNSSGKQFSKNRSGGTGATREQTPASPPAVPAVPDDHPPEIFNGEIVDLDPDPEPPRFCRHHPDGTSQGCWLCRDAREIHDAWKQRQPRPSTTDLRVAQTQALKKNYSRDHPPELLS